MLLEAPFTEEKIRKLRVGDKVEITGLLYTGRDAVHKYLHEGGKPPVDLTNSIIYHCGPVVSRSDAGEYKFIAAGPTTSIREEPYEADVLEYFGVRAIIGKGGMGPETLQACQHHKAVYLHAIGGAASLIAHSVKEVVDVYQRDELGIPEAFWVIRVEHFPAVVTMDSHGDSLHAEVKERSTALLQTLIRAGSSYG